MQQIPRHLSFALALFVALCNLGGLPTLAQRQPAPRRAPASASDAGRASSGTTQRRAPAVAAPQATQAASSQQLPARPRLVLLIAVDQFRYDYLERFGDLFGAQGLRRLMRDGAVWTDANFDHVPTETAPGHATMMTGAWPSETGIIGNEWFDRDSGKRVTSVVDEAVQLFGGGTDEKASSPRRLLASTVGDELRLHTAGRSKVIGISLKDRSAILPAGRHANAAYWFSVQTGRVVSSSYYFVRPPEWVTRFNDARPSDKFFGARWERLLPEAEYLRRAGADAPPWEALNGATDAAFPHIINGGMSAPGREFYEGLAYSPYANDLILDFAQAAITNEALGSDDDTDVLTVSFSANDYVGHRYGPQSQETMDMALRVDQQIGRLLDFVDARVGLNRTLVAFTADHGVAPVPEHAASLGLPGLRIKADDVLTAVKNGIRACYNRGGADRDTTADYVLQYTPKNGNVYFNTVALARDQINREELERVAGDAALTVPGVARYFTRTQLASGAISPSEAVARRVLHGFRPRCIDDLVIVNKAFTLIVTYTPVHYSPYSYDTHVPVILMGARIAPGRYSQPAAPSDIAPTLTTLLRIERPSNAMGRVLIEALR